MERKHMEVDFLIKGIEEVLDNEKVLSEEDDDKNVQLLNSKPSVPFSPAKSKSTTREFSKLLEMNKDNVLRGIIFSEIFGTPRARRKR